MGPKMTTSDRLRITSVRFHNFKALQNFFLSLRRLNVLVGPNNSGKSTILGAFRALSAGIRRAKSKSSEFFEGPSGQVRLGYNIPEDSLPISIENVHTNYSDQESLVTFRLSDDSRFLLFFPENGGCRFFAECASRAPSSPSGFRKRFPLDVGVVPVLGPVEHDESLLAIETVQRNLATHRASRHFRNYWHYYPEEFQAFADLIEETWPGMAVKPVEIDFQTSKLAMFCEENRISRELYWIGSGFQIWCQILTHLFRAKEDSLLIIDEPEIYLHPDVQRKLVGILRNIGPDVLLATHSTEMIAEAEHSDIVLVDKTQTSGERLRGGDAIQSAFDHLGSSQNIVHTQVARKRKIIFVEGEDIRVIRWFARLAGRMGVADGSEFVAIPLGGFDAWRTIEHRRKGIVDALGKREVLCACILDRDFRCDEEVAEITASLSSVVELVHVHERKEIENYVLLCEPIQRAIDARAKEGGIRGNAATRLPSISTLLGEITSPMKHTVAGQLTAKRQNYFRASHSKLDTATINAEALRLVDQKWGLLATRLELLPAKDVLSALNSRLNALTGTTLSVRDIIDEMHLTDLSNDLIGLLSKLEDFVQRKV